MADFQQALKMVLDHEGGYQALTSDTGNAGGHGTNRGITYATLKDWYNKHGKSAPGDLDIKNLSLADTASIYQELYWTPLSGNAITDQNRATVLLDASVVMGVNTVVKFAQTAVAQPNMQKDGTMGPKTLAAINALPRRQFLEPLCYLLQGRFLDCIAQRPENVSWERVWLRRAADWLCLVY